jgi:hypothetical protein
MRRPLPPELVVLGDHLESAVRRSAGRRRTRRQMILNSATALLVALPLVPAVMGTMAAPAVEPPVVPAETRGYGGAEDDFPPRVLRGPGNPAGGALAEPSTLRRAMR